MSNQIQRHFDIIINGGGIVGFSLLNCIRKSPYLSRYKVLLIEQANKPPTLKQPSRFSDDSNPDSLRHFSNRVSSITPASRLALKKLGVWDRISDYSKDVKLIKVWNYDFMHKLVFEPEKLDKYGEEESIMFSVLENDRLSRALLANLEHEQNLEAIIWNHALEGFEQSSSDGSLNVFAKNQETGENFSASTSLLLGCDGFKSRVRQLSAMDYHEVELNTSAIVGTARMDLSTINHKNDIAYQRFSAGRDSVLALLPLDKNHCSFVMSAPKKLASYLMDCDDKTFIEEINEVLSADESPSNELLKTLNDVSNMVLSSLENSSRTSPASEHYGDLFESPPRLDSLVESSRASFPLLFGTTTPKMVAPERRIALLGDSTHRVHPLAGQGLNLGIQDVSELVRQMEIVAARGENIFSLKDNESLEEALKCYEMKRQAYLIPMMGGILSMPHLFKLVPSRVLSALNRCDPIKSSFVKFANGF